MVNRGFTLIELLVSTAVFTTVMVIALGALLALAEADRKAQTLNAAVNNLSFALDSMSRTIRTGSNYHCGNNGTLTDTANCAGSDPESFIAVLAADGSKVAYCFDNGAIKRHIIQAGVLGNLGSDCTSEDFLPLTATDVSVTNLSFYVTGTPIGDTIQPKVTILVSGYVPVTETRKTKFNLQTSVTQRIYDK
jgi:prepilin-type N-terminal cleavage/methylation domain-containing protein